MALRMNKKTGKLVAVGVGIAAAVVIGYYLLKTVLKTAMVSMNSATYISNVTQMHSYTTVRLPTGVRPVTIYNMIAGVDNVFHQDVVHPWDVTLQGYTYDTNYGACPFTPGTPYKLYSVVTLSTGEMIQSNVTTFSVT